MKSYLDEPFTIQANKQVDAEIALPLEGVDMGGGEQIEGVRLGSITDVDEDGRILVDYPGSRKGPLVARLTNSANPDALRKSGIGREVLLVFENGDPDLPIIIDMMHLLLDEVSESSSIVVEGEKPEDVLIDGKRIIFDAKEEIVLRCGKASITLTKAGKVLIKGAYLLSRSSGVNKIKGGSIQLN